MEDVLDENRQLKGQLARLAEQCSLKTRDAFGRKSEKLSGLLDSTPVADEAETDGTGESVENALADCGIVLFRQTMCNWILRFTSDVFGPVYDRMMEALMQLPHHQCDETTACVNRDGRKAGRSATITCDAYASQTLASENPGKITVSRCMMRIPNPFISTILFYTYHAAL